MRRADLMSCFPSLLDKLRRAFCFVAPTDDAGLWRTNLTLESVNAFLETMKWTESVGGTHYRRFMELVAFECRRYRCPYGEVQTEIEKYQNEQDKGPIFTCTMLATTTCDDICDDVQLRAAHALRLYREGCDVTVHWMSRDGAIKTLDGTLLKVWATSQTVVDTQTPVADTLARVCANPLCKRPFPKKYLRQEWQYF